MNELQSTSKIKAVAGPLAERLGEETAILDPVSGLYFGLNDVGTRVWDLLQETTSLDAIVEQLTQEYEVEPARCRADVQTLLGKLLEAKLIEIVHEGAV